MKEIQLTQGKVAIVDDEDYEWLSQYKWCAIKCKHTYYTTRHITVHDNNKKKKKTIYMHIPIMEHKVGRLLKKYEEVDHINGNGLDNRQCNLRIASRSQQCMNQRKTRGVSQYKGVTWHKNNRKWLTQIVCEQKHIYVGYFENEIDAAKAYDKKAKELFGEFARPNFGEIKL